MKTINKETIHLFFILITFEALALYCLKKYSVDKEKSNLCLGIIFYGLVAYMISKIILINKTISLTNVVWNVLSSIYGIIIGCLLFYEKVNFKQIIGVNLAILSLILINSD